MKIHYEVNLDDLVAWKVYHFDHSPAMKRSQASNALVPSAVWLAIGVAGAIASHEPAMLLLPILAVSGIWVLASPSYLRWATVRQVRKLYAEGANKGTLGPHDLELADSRLIERTPVNEHSVLLESIEKVERTDTHTFVYLSAVLAHVVPRAAVGERDYEEFVHALEERVANANGR